MKTIIIDISAIMAIIGKEPDKPKLIEVTQDVELIAPPLGNRECRFRPVQEKTSEPGVQHLCGCVKLPKPP